ncbi:MAG: hypothetical protein LBF16_08205 [Pseudomonadales bacterium]|nr:hypothetical protein [Pseudomonadales bacterium]
MTATEREEMRHSGLSENSIYIAESEAADLADDDETAWAWFRLAKIPADFLLTLKHNGGADYVRSLGLNLAPAEAAYGPGWLDNPSI